MIGITLNINVECCSEVEVEQNLQKTSNLIHCSTNLFHFTNFPIVLIFHTCQT